MKPSFRNWTNPYIDQIETIPDLILSCFDGSPNAEELAILQNKIAGFKNIFCELGTGSGKHIIELATRDPDSLFIGFELRYKRAFLTAKKALEGGLNNILILRTNAHSLPDLVRKSSLGGIYVNFPDPWEKKRWEKHRMLKDDFLEKIPEILKNGGFLAYKTDHLERFRETVDSIRRVDRFEIVHLTEDLHNSEFMQDNIITEFERLFTSKQMETYYLRAESH